MDRATRKQRTLKMVQLAILLALVIVLQLFGSSIKVGATSFSLVLIPIALGGMLLGAKAGAFLGFVFGLITLIAGITGTDAFTQILFQDHPFLTSLTCLGKATAAGLVSGLLYRVVAKKNRYLAAFTAAAAAPIVNTGLFILCALLMSDTLSANFVADGTTVIYFLVIGCAGINFIVEFCVNLLVSPALHMVTDVVSKQLRR